MLTHHRDVAIIVVAWPDIAVSLMAYLPGRDDLVITDGLRTVNPIGRPTPE